MKNELEKIPVSEQLEACVQSSLQQLKKEQKSKRYKKGIASITAVAACAAFVVVCNVNPVWASKLPVIGQIFAEEEQKIGDKGNYSENATVLISEEESDNRQENSPYIQTSNGITIRIPEVTYTKRALYLAVEISSEKGFSDNFIRSQSMPDYALDYDILNVHATGKCDFDEKEFRVEGVEGHFADNHNFNGIIRVDIGHLSEQKVPEQFGFELNINNLWAEILTDYSKTETYEGEWNFYFDVALDSSKTQTVVVGETNENGVGIDTVEKTPYEITASMLLPEGVDKTKYMLVICDAAGDLLENQGEYADIYQTYGRDTSSIYVYVCDEIEYLDELKGYYWSEDYPQKKQEKTFAQYLEEHALYGTSVEFQ